MNHCCVPFCKSARGGKEKIGFFEFPSKVQQRLLWQDIIIKATSRSNNDIEYKFLDRSVVCEKHFTEEDFSKSTKRRRILPGVVPSVFSYSSPPAQKNKLDKRKHLNAQINPLIKNSCLTDVFETDYSSKASMGKNNSFESYGFIQNIESHSKEVQSVTNFMENNKQTDLSPFSNKMKCCCVPYCKSVQGGKENVSFFEFPSNLQQRTWWEKVISQVILKSGYPWKPSDQLVVCGKHFMETDFSKNTTKRKLLPGVVPSVFSNFPSDKQKQLFNQVKITSKINSPLKKSCSYEELGKNILFNSLNEENNILDYKSINQNIECPTRDIRKEVSCEERTKQLIKKLQRRINTLQKINSNLHFKLKGLNRSYFSLKSKKKREFSEEKLYRKILQGKVEHKLPAIMLFEQIKNFGMNKVSFSKTAMKLYFLWEERSPKSYDFVRNMRIFTLPHKNTLNKYLEFSKEETKTTSDNKISVEIEELET